VVLLQSGDAETLALWEIFVAESLRHNKEVYDMLGVLLTDDDVVGESFYNPWLPVVVGELGDQGLLVEDDGALCVFPEGFVNRQGDPLPLIVRKSDQGYGYPATDLACIRDRTGRRGATNLVYVVGLEQTLHFRLVFAVAELAGYLLDASSAVHVGFGLVLGPDGKKLASRAGGPERLVDLLSEGVERARARVAERESDLTAPEQDELARILGIGAVKYADLSTERARDYVFDWDRMLSFDGNTAVYLLYAYVRVRSIFRRAEATPVGPSDVGAVLLSGSEERALALLLLRFDLVVHQVADTLEPHRLCNYLFDVAQAYTTFFEACPVLRAETPELRRSRLVLCELTARTLERGLGLLGIGTVEQM
jgi:arginyl-tRNA synthetase